MDQYVIGVDLGGTNIKIAAYSIENLASVYERRIPTEAHNGWEHVMNRIYNGLTDLFQVFPQNQFSCVGLGIPGLLDIEKGISQFSPNFPSWENVPVVAWLQERLKLPVYIDNDVRVNLYGEWYCGAGRGKKNVVLLTLGTGLGSGIVVDGHVLYGATASAGEVGHMNMFRQGRPCKCGSSGCLGRYVSALGFVRTLIEKLEDGTPCIIREWVNGDLERVTAKMISDAYDSDDRIAVETMTETGEILGFGLVNIINLFNPEIIIIGGGMSAAGERLLQPARKVVDSHALRISRSNCYITTAQLGDAAGMLGAAIYAKQRLTNCESGLIKIINGGINFDI